MLSRGRALTQEAHRRPARPPSTVARTVLRWEKHMSHDEAKAPWERIRSEPDYAWSLFSRFVTSQHPTIASFAREIREESYQTIATLAARWRWRARRAALDEHLHAARIAGATTEAHAQGQAHARATSAALEWATESILAARSRGEELAPRDAIAYIRTAVDLQRVAAGEATQRTSVDLSGATDEQLDALRRAYDEVGVR